MPHSRQQQQAQQIPMGGAFGGGMSPGSGFIRMDYRSSESMMMGHHHHHHHHSPSWMRGVPRQSHLHHVSHTHPHHMIHKSRSSSSVEEQRMRPMMTTSHSHDSSSSSRGSPRQDYSSQDSPRQVAASVLMLAKSRSDSAEERSRPLKKRKTFTTPSTLPCHVSPVSMHTEDQTSPETPHSRADDMDENKLSRSRTTTPVVIPHFPSVLHMLLTASREGIIEWLSHGRAWRIVRWESLRKQLLPQFFPQLQSMDSFLGHLTAWGFEEVTNGPDVGAYKHEKFIRDLPEMCRDMTLAGENVGNNVDSPRSILRVPSLSGRSAESVATPLGNQSKQQIEEDESDLSCGDEERSPKTPNMTSDRVETPTGSIQHTSSAWDHMEGRPVFVNYRPNSGSSIPPYSPIQIQSGRGRRSFFVSNRGRRVIKQRRALPVTGESRQSPSPPMQPTGLDGKSTPSSSFES